MFTAYLLRSLSTPEQTYIGQTSILKKRLSDHNSGHCFHTAKYCPWRVVVSITFDCEQKAIEFEKYLKSGSGRAFAQRHLW